MALFTTLQNDADSSGVEVSGGAYARAAVTNNSTNWPASTDGSKSNGNSIDFPTATASWGTVLGFGIYDAASGGNLLFHGSLGSSKAIASSDTPSFAAGSITITFA